MASFEKERALAKNIPDVSQQTSRTGISLSYYGGIWRCELHYDDDYV